MTTQPTDFEQPRDRGGRFATFRSAEAAISLVPPLPQSIEPAPVRSVSEAEVSAAYEVANMLVAFRTGDGSFCEPASQDDVSEMLRARFGALSDRDFDRHMATIGAAAEVCSVMERACIEPHETEAWREIAEGLGVEETDYPTPVEEWAPGDPYTDWADYCEAVNAEAGLRLYEAVRSLAHADAEG
ncbi:hypothetical protein [Nocardioides sp. Leaf285]|uniref:hypothetical protein n=1 Tax=Nocardioides sp. Leaf285 TaxID=1736322 RepID=UPI000702AB7A|nr:hypothetical protein [Nocardioides sp. Leaf285]KQP62860.1 hypothetical protein ASF47_17765 [Nocardioides sp. Leaf285]